MQHHLKFANRAVLTILISLSCTNFGMQNEEQLREEQLRSAAIHGDMHTVNRLLVAETNVNVDASDGNGFTALMWATMFGHSDVVTRLLQAGANINATNEAGQTALMRAIISQDTDLISLLLEAGANPHVIDHEGNTALHWAISFGNDDIIEQLTKAMKRQSSASLPKK
jgi:ankyrin repeat protein